MAVGISQPLTPGSPPAPFINEPVADALQLLGPLFQDRSPDWAEQRMLAFQLGVMTLRSSRIRRACRRVPRDVAPDGAPELNTPSALLAAFGAAFQTRHLEATAVLKNDSM